MDYEFIVMLLGFLAVLGTVVISFLNLSGRIDSLGRDVGKVRVRVARLEGRLEGYFARARDDNSPSG